MTDAAVINGNAPAGVLAMNRQTKQWGAARFDPGSNPVWKWVGPFTSDRASHPYRGKTAASGRATAMNDHLTVYPWIDVAKL